MSEEVTVSYTTTRRDLIVFSMIHFARSPLTWVMLVALVGLSLPGTISSLGTDLGWAFVVVGTVVVELIFVVAFVAIIMLVVLVSSLFADPGSGLSEHTITLTPESLTEVTSLNTNVVKWGGVRRVVRLRNYLAMYVGRSVAHVVPRRAFATAQEWERFCDLALDSFRASQSQSERTAA